MVRVGWIGRVVRNRPTLVTFLPVALFVCFLAFASFVPVPMPTSVLEVVESLFYLLVYLPVDLFATLLLDPVGVRWVLQFPVVGQAVVFATLLAFYYALTAAAVSIVRVVAAELDSRR